MQTCKLSLRLLFLLAYMLLSFASFAFSSYSNSQLDKLEKEFITLLNRSPQIIRYPLINQYVNHLGERISLSTKMQVPHFFVIDSSELNAFAGPGGYIGLHSPLILMTENESELAAVMAHEIAHVRLHHLYRMIEHQKQMQIPMVASLLASIALGILDPTLGGGAMMASLSHFIEENIHFTRAKEKEADRIGINMLTKAGLDPRAMASFFKKMQEHSRYYFSDIPAFLRTHPLDEERIAEAENRSQRLRKQNYNSHPHYFLFKEFIRVQTSKDSKALMEYYQNAQKSGNPSEIVRYGQAWAFLKNHQPQAAEELFSKLVEVDQHNLFYQLGLAEAALQSGKFQAAKQRWQTLNQLYPENYAVLSAYGEGLIYLGEGKAAAQILRQASRIYPKDLWLCQNLAKAEASIPLKGQAYFTQAQCEILQGNRRAAMRDLRLAKQLSLKNNYLQARIKAKIEEIKML